MRVLSWKMLRFLLIGLSLFFAVSAFAQERILNYDIIIDIQKNADLIVTENITVNSEGRSIKRGIFRDLPRYKLDEDDTIPYQYQILSVTKNGEKEPFDNSVAGNAKRVRIGDADVFLENGEYTYVIQYRVKNEIRYREGEDELYWNAIGKFWKFRIDKSRVSITFPEGMSAAAIRDINAYVGYSSEPEYTYRVTSDFDPLVIELLGYMDGNSGLTVSVIFDKGVVDPPSSADKTTLWWFKNGALYLLSFCFIGLFGYYYLAWNKVGRDPKKLPVYPRYMPPAGYSAAAVNRLANRFSGGNDALIATLMSLAVKGAVHIESKKKTTKIKYLGTEFLSEPLLNDESFLLAKLFKKTKSVTLDGESNRKFTSAHSAFDSHLSKKYAKGYFKWNIRYTIMGIILSMLALIVVMSQVYGAWKEDFTFIFIALLLMNVLFVFLMPAPTKKGRTITSEIEGFKLYLKTAESKRFAKQVSENVAEAPPTMTQELYERYLPYAVALDVEKPWSKYFENILPDVASDNYSPSWGSSSNSGGGARGFSKSLSSNLSSGVSSAMPQSSGSSGSSGGGGGGSSGGGGGGGGGGGW